MPTNVWKVKDRLGNSAVREITTDTVEQSKSILLCDGCTDSALMTDNGCGA
jgi:hypothetical protein